MPSQRYEPLETRFTMENTKESVSAMPVRHGARMGIKTCPDLDRSRGQSRPLENPKFRSKIGRFLQNLSMSFDPLFVKWRQRSFFTSKNQWGNRDDTGKEFLDKNMAKNGEFFGDFLEGYFEPKSALKMA